MIDSISIQARRTVTTNQPAFLNRATVWFMGRLRYWLTVETAALELYAAVDALLLGMFLIAPFETFGSSPTFAFVNRVASEQTWGGILLAVGVAQIAGLNGVNHRLREVMAVASAIIWAIWGVGLMRSNAASTATITYPMLTLAMMWAYICSIARRHEPTGPHKP